jgi:hypothetical protein
MGSDSNAYQHTETDTFCGIGFSSDNAFNDNLNKGEYVQGCRDARRDHPPDEQSNYGAAKAGCE